MMSERRSEPQFILSMHPGLSGAASAETRRQVRSQAARAAHAKLRRQRVITHQATSASGSSHSRSRPFRGELAVRADIPVLSSPATLLGASRKDPFASFARRLISTEDFLLDYCKPCHLESAISLPTKKFTTPPRPQIMHVTNALTYDRQAKCGALLTPSTQRGQSTGKLRMVPQYRVHPCCCDQHHRSERPLSCGMPSSFTKGSVRRTATSRACSSVQGRLCAVTARGHIVVGNTFRRSRFYRCSSFVPRAR